MRKIKDLYVCDRPREKIVEKGVGSLNETELISVVLGSGIAGRDVFEVAKDVEKTLNLSKDLPDYNTLIGIKGIGKTKAAQLVACFELARRRYAANERHIVKIYSPEDVLPLVSDIRDKKQEYLIAITLNGASEVIEKRIVTIGILNRSILHPREVFADAISDHAARIIIVHNHPSGSKVASKEDLESTMRIAEAGILLGIPLMDHIIVTPNDYLSFKNEGLYKF